MLDVLCAYSLTSGATLQRKHLRELEEMLAASKEAGTAFLSRAPLHLTDEFSI